MVITVSAALSNSAKGSSQVPRADRPPGGSIWPRAYMRCAVPSEKDSMSPGPARRGGPRAVVQWYGLAGASGLARSGSAPTGEHVGSFFRPTRASEVRRRQSGSSFRREASADEVVTNLHLLGLSGSCNRWSSWTKKLVMLGVGSSKKRTVYENGRSRIAKVSCAVGGSAA